MLVPPGTNVIVPDPVNVPALMVALVTARLPLTVPESTSNDDHDTPLAKVTEAPLTSSRPAPLDVPAIERLLPHRYPFLMIDRIVELGDEKVVALKNVSANEPFFTGHFPGHPIMPVSASNSLKRTR